MDQSSILICRYIPRKFSRSLWYLQFLLRKYTRKFTSVFVFLFLEKHQNFKLDLEVATHKVVKTPKLYQRNSKAQLSTTPYKFISLGYRLRDFFYPANGRAVTSNSYFPDLGVFCSHEFWRPCNPLYFVIIAFFTVWQ